MCKAHTRIGECGIEQIGYGETEKSRIQEVVMEMGTSGYREVKEMILWKLQDVELNTLLEKEDGQKVANVGVKELPMRDGATL